MFPTHLPKEGDEDGTTVQCVWSWGELGLYLKPNGRLTICYKGKDRVSSIEPHLDINSPLLPNKWYHVTVIARNTAGASNNYYCELTIMQRDEISKKESQLLSVEVCIKNSYHHPGPMIPMDAHFELATGGTFNGRLENPKITTRDETAESAMNRLLVIWDTFRNMTEWSIPSDDNTSIQKDNPLLLHNHPTRAVRGRLWDGTEFNWKHQPSHYGGIHFHNDDVYAFNWDCDMEWTIPQNIPSGIYIMRLVNEQCEEESLPLFICPPLVQLNSGDDGEKKKKICILISTFTYGKCFPIHIK